MPKASGAHEKPSLPHDETEDPGRFFAQSPLSYQSLDAEGCYLDVNPTWERTFGYSRAEILGRKFSEIMTEDSQALVAERFPLLKELGEVHDVCFELSHKQGQVMQVTLHGRSNYDRQGNFLSSNCVLLDVSATRKAHEQLMQSEQKNRLLSQQLQALLDGIPDRILFLDPDLKMLWTNQKADLSGQPFKKNPIGEYCYEMMHQKELPCSDCPALECFKTGQHAHFERVNPDGQTWSRRAFPVHDDHGQVVNVVEIGQNITEIVRLREDAARTGQLAALGELAAGVAHEINNPINGVLNCAQMLINRSAAESQDRNISERIVTDAERVASIVNKLLFHARKDREEMKPLDVTGNFSEVLALVGSQFKSDGIVIDLQSSEGLPKINGNAQQLQQLFLNILSNARYALNQRYPQGNARKRVEVRIQLEEIESGPAIQIRCHDHGIGIPAELLSKVKQPFITSKPATDGTGLGLSISNDIVKNHGGTLNITSEPDSYTEVVVHLPLNA